MINYNIMIEKKNKRRLRKNESAQYSTFYIFYCNIIYEKASDFIKMEQKYNTFLRDKWNSFENRIFVQSLIRGSE